MPFETSSGPCTPEVDTLPNAAQLCAALIRAYPLYADHAQKTVYYTIIAASICLLEIAREKANISRQALNTFNCDSIVPVARSLFESITDKTETQILKQVLSIKHPDIKQIEKSLLRSTIDIFNPSIQTGPKDLGGPSYYSQLYKKLFLLAHAFTAYETSRLYSYQIALNLPVLDLPTTYLLTPISPPTPPPSIMMPRSSTQENPAAMQAQQFQHSIFDNDTANNLMRPCPLSFFNGAHGHPFDSLPPLINPYLDRFVQAGKLLRQDASLISFSQCEASSLRSCYMQQFVLEDKISLQEALSIPYEAFAASALALKCMQPLFMQNRLSITQGLALSIEEIHPRHILSLKDTDLTPPQRLRQRLYNRYKERACLDETDPLFVAVMESRLQYIELTVLLYFKDPKTPREARELELLLQDKVCFKNALRIAALEYQLDQNPHTVRELNLWHYHCLIYTVPHVVQEDQIVEIVALEEYWMDTNFEDVDSFQQLMEYYFNLCFHMLPPLSSEGPSLALDLQADRIREERIQAMDYTIKKHLVLYYLQDVQKIPTSKLGMGVMPGYILEKIALLRMGIMKYFIDTCTHYSQDIFDRVVTHIQDKLKAQELTLNHKYKIMTLADCLPPLTAEAGYSPSR